eukprot:5204134-Alexandrium_andersonii.AAC.1
MKAYGAPVRMGGGVRFQRTGHVQAARDAVRVRLRCAQVQLASGPPCHQEACLDLVLKLSNEPQCFVAQGPVLGHDGRGHAVARGHPARGVHLIALPELSIRIVP